MATWNRSGYSQSDMNQMQQDAMRRVREMQARARANLEQTNSGEMGPPPPPRPPHMGMGGPSGMGAGHTGQGNAPAQGPAGGTEAHHREEIPKVKATQVDEHPKGILKSITGIFEALGLEQDHLILILLIFVLLSTDNSDKTLILALCYLLL